MVKIIRVQEDTHQKLKSYGHKGQTFDDIINILINKVEQK